MRLLFLHNRSGHGGSNLCLLDTLSALQQFAPDIELGVVSGAEGPFADGCRRLGIEPVRLPMPHWRKWTDRLRFGGAVRQIARARAAAPPDWILANEHWWAPLAVKLARRLGARSAAFVRDGSPAAPGRPGKYLLDQLDRILASSSRITGAFRDDPGCRARVVTLFDATRVLAGGGHRLAELRARLAAAPGVEHWLGVVGSVDARKDQVQAVETLGHLRSLGFAGTGLILAGGVAADYGPRLNRRIAELGLADRVIQLGHWDDIPGVLSVVDALLLTSRSEGLPRSITEALLAGKPAFMFACEGVEDIFADQIDTFVTARDPSALAARIVVLWREPNRIASLVASLQTRLDQQFHPRQHVESLLACLATTPGVT